MEITEPGVYLAIHKGYEGDRLVRIEVYEVQGDLYWSFYGESTAYPVETGQAKRWPQVRKVTDRGTP